MTGYSATICVPVSAVVEADADRWGIYFRIMSDVMLNKAISWSVEDEVTDWSRRWTIVGPDHEVRPLVTRLMTWLHTAAR